MISEVCTILVVLGLPCPGDRIAEIATIAPSGDERVRGPHLGSVAQLVEPGARHNAETPDVGGSSPSRTSLVLARVAFAEAGLDNHEDHAAVWHVLRRRSRLLGISIEQTAKRYCSLYKTNHKRAQKIRGLRAEGHRLSDSPRRGRVSERQAWIATIKRAQLFLKGNVEDPCAEPAVHFGDRHGDKLRAERAGWRRVSCPTKNLFWAIR